MDPWMMAGAAVAVGAVLYWISRYRRLGPEVSVGALLEQLDGKYAVLSGAIVQGEQGMIRIDHAVVSPFGVFVIKQCREAGRVEVRLNKEEWGIAGGGGRKKMYNHVWDVRKVIQKLERLVGEFPYMPLVVFTRARLTGERDIGVLEARDLIGRIRSFSEPRLTEDQQRKIVGILG